MRVLYFSHDYTPHDHRFLSALAESEHEVFYLRLERRGRRLEDRPLPDRVTPIAWAGGESPAGLSALPALVTGLQQVIAGVQPDLVHAGPVQSAALLAAAVGFRPLVTMSWGSDLLVDADRSRWLSWATRFTLERTTVLLGDCDAVRRKAAGFGFPPERVRLFPWGVDLDHFSPAMENTAPGADPFVVLSLRSWEPIYGVDVLVRGFALAAQVEPRLQLRLYGGGSQAALLRQILAEHGVLDRVHFGGQVPYAELPGVYRAADLYVSASHSDGSSVSLMEALACGRPVLLSDIPTNLEWVTPGVEGWVFADGDAPALAGCLLQAIAQRDRLAEMGQAARILAERRADWR
ncbi:MAG TPA: glycosyltransferase, partial [Anaerolineaceae bacterium]|nr:glycosyltransferase [Anaerolineaceae bacterium]